jgi:hypothetical protein
MSTQVVQQGGQPYSISDAIRELFAMTVLDVTNHTYIKTLHQADRFAVRVRSIVDRIHSGQLEATVGERDELSGLADDANRLRGVTAAEAVRLAKETLGVQLRSGTEALRWLLLRYRDRIERLGEAHGLRYDPPTATLRAAG